MLILIVWGTKTRDDALGQVVDACPVCDGVRVFLIQEHYQVPHFSGIPLGRMRLVEVTRTCTVCGQQIPCNPNRYDTIVPVAIAQTRRFMDLLNETNSVLANGYEFSDIVSRGPSEQRIGPVTQVFDADATKHRLVASSSSTDYREVQELFALLEKSWTQGDAAAPYFDELRNWRSLNAAQKQSLRQRVARFVAEQATASKARKFLRHVAAHWPKTIGLLDAVVLFVVLALLALPLPFLMPFLPNGDAIASVGFWWVFGLLIVGYMVYIMRLNAARAAWLMSNFLAEADDWEVDGDAVLQVLDEPVDQSWDRATIWAVIKMRRFKAQIELLVDTFDESKSEDPQ